MLQNGTVISGTLIEKAAQLLHRLQYHPAQIIAQVASCQYGGQSISLAHLAPFVDISRKKNIQRCFRGVLRGGDWKSPPKRRAR